VQGNIKTGNRTQKSWDSDKELVDQILSGSREHFDLLYEAYFTRVYRFALKRLGDPGEAEDVTQEAMLRLWQIAPRWQAGGAQPSTWLHRVAVNLATDRLRKRRGVGLDEIAEPDDPSPSVVDGMMQTDRLRALDEALAMLPDRQRVAVVLRHLEGMNNPEIAASMGIGVEAVESLTARGKRRLAQLLQGRRDDLGYDR